LRVGSLMVTRLVRLLAAAGQAAQGALAFYLVAHVGMILVDTELQGGGPLAWLALLLSVTAGVLLEVKVGPFK
jgi:hypothetical protein